MERAAEDEEAAGRRGAESAAEAGAGEEVGVKMELSGVLAKDERTGNVFRGRTMKFVEPPDARTPAKKWRFHVFLRDEDKDEVVPLYTQSAYLFGRDDGIADIPTLHPSCSSQHAVLQFRLTPLPPRPSAAAAAAGTSAGTGPLSVRPYIMDLESTNGTFLNGERIEAARYIELRHQDVLRFGQSTREYVLIREW